MPAVSAVAVLLRGNGHGGESEPPFRPDAPHGLGTSARGRGPAVPPTPAPPAAHAQASWSSRRRRSPLAATSPTLGSACSAPLRRSRSSTTCSPFWRPESVHEPSVAPEWVCEKWHGHPARGASSHRHSADDSWAGSLTVLNISALSRGVASPKALPPTMVCVAGLLCSPRGQDACDTQGRGGILADRQPGAAVPHGDPETPSSRGGLHRTALAAAIRPQRIVERRAVARLVTSNVLRRTKRPT